MPQFRGAFRYHRKEYDLPITDPTLEAEFRRDQEDLHEGRDFALPIRTGLTWYATISIGEEFKNGFCYKLIAALFYIPWSLNPTR
jgi:hypothetical protein